MSAMPMISISGHFQRLMQHRLKQPPPRFVSRGEARFQPVAQGHQFIDFGDDAVLLGEGWEGNRNAIHFCLIHFGLRRSSNIPLKIGCVNK